jgi:predicted molibdopterin-dependent oxidoreductase YjgC
MNTIHLNIDDNEIAANSGQTILQVCRGNNIPIPTLCSYEGLSTTGGCRLCIVEVQGQRRPVSSCTTPAEDRMVVRTDTPQLHELRRQTIELLFSERNHICPFCPASGQCELQNAAYGHSIDHVRYDYCFPMLEMDNSHRYIALDHNRCILCTRCIRACDEWVGAHILDTDHRGLATMLIADNGIPLGESKCVSCGACVTVCPTGALFEKRSAHWQGRLPLKQAETICVGCGVGCRISASVCHRQIGEINSAGGPSGNRVLCERGRFGLVDPSEPRLNAITMRRGSERIVRSLDDALAECVRRLNAAPVQADPDRVIGLMSPRLPLETLAASRGFLTNVVGSNTWSLMDRTNTTAVREGLGINGKLVPLATLHELDEADLFLLVGCNLERSHGVVASYVRRAALHRRARLVKINPRHTWLTDWTDLYLPVERGRDAFVLSAILKYLIEMGRTKAFVPQELADQLRRLDDDTVHALTGLPVEDLRKAARMYAEAERPMIICGVGLSRSGPQGLAAAMNLVRATGQKSASGRLRLMEVAMGANTVGGRLLEADTLDIARFDPHSADCAFVVLGDECRPWPTEWIEKMKAVSFVVALTARRHPLVEFADVVIPTATWAERSGTYVNLEGRVQKAGRLMVPPVECVDELAFFEKLAPVWRGPDYALLPPGLPESIEYVADGHMVPCDVQDHGLDPAGVQELISRS